MTANDFVTGLFEIGAFLMQAMNVHALIRDKKVSGVSVWPWLFFMLLGFWQVYAFACGIGPFSSFCALLVALTNLTWLVLAVKFKLEEVVV